MDKYMNAAIDEAKKGLEEGGIPIGSVIVYKGEIIGRGHNRRIQNGSTVLHGEMDALENAGRQPTRYTGNPFYIQPYRPVLCVPGPFCFMVYPK